MSSKAWESFLNTILFGLLFGLLIDDDMCDIFLINNFMLQAGRLFLVADCVGELIGLDDWLDERDVVSRIISNYRSEIEFQTTYLSGGEMITISMRGWWSLN